MDKFFIRGSRRNIRHVILCLVVGFFKMLQQILFIANLTIVVVADDIES